MIKDLVLGAGYVLKGFRLVTQPGIKRFAVVPLLINSLIFAAVIILGAHQFQALIDSLLPGWLDWLEFLLWPLFAIIAMGIVFFTFTLVTNLIGAPFNGYLAEAVEQRMTGEKLVTQNSQPLLAEILRSIRAEGRKLLYFLIRAIPVLILMIVPFTSAVGAALWFLLGCWMLSLEYSDYPMANHQLPFPTQRAVLAKRRWLALGFGAGTMLLVLIPILNFVAMPVAVAGATAMWLEQLKGTSNSLTV